MVNGSNHNDGDGGDDGDDGDGAVKVGKQVREQSWH